jgi:hypothetical protein
MTKCITCGTELHPERALKYSYCMAPECQQKNARGLTIAAIGMNKSGEEFMILDERTREELASGRYHDQRRGSFGTSQAAPPVRPAGAAAVPAQRAARRARPRPQPQRRPQAPARGPWTAKQERLALLYNEQGLRPAEIADKLGASSYLVTQIILAAKNRGKL